MCSHDNCRLCAVLDALDELNRERRERRRQGKRGVAEARAAAVAEAARAIDANPSRPLNFRTPTGDIEVWESGIAGNVGVAIDATTPKSGPVRMVVSLTPYQALQTPAAPEGTER